MRMSQTNRLLEREALGWLVLVNDPGFAAWDEWEAWLVADPSHADAYWRLAAEEADVSQALRSAPESLTTR
ncbi:MAG: hypothetical protein RSG56_03670, partial [Brevundimonas sp.]